MRPDSPPGGLKVARDVELRGHIIDSGIFGRVLGFLTDREESTYTINEVTIGQRKEDESVARLTVAAEDPALLDELLDKLRELGAEVVSDDDAVLAPCPADGVLPDDFYATTNLESEVRIGGAWRPVELPEMDCAIVVTGTRARTVAPSDAVADALVDAAAAHRAQR